LNIFIDESGGFQPNPTDAFSISCIGAVVVAGRILADVERGFNLLSAQWPKDSDGEVKGRLLDEHHIAQLCEFLMPFNVLFHPCVMDMNLCSVEDVNAHRSGQAEGMTINLTDAHHPDVVAAVWKLREILERMPRQLYAQAVAMTEAVCEVFELGQLYFCQRWPGELARFRWVVDAKNREKITEYEYWWKEAVMPLIQSRSLREPMKMLKGGDYSAYRRHFPEGPLGEHLGIPQEKGVNLKLIFRELEFAESSTSIGLQIADILTNALRRALSGRLGREGWSGLADLTIHQREGAIVLKNLGRPSGFTARPYGRVLCEINAGGRSLLVARKRTR